MFNSKTFRLEFRSARGCLKRLCSTYEEAAEIYCDWVEAFDEDKSCGENVHCVVLIAIDICGNEMELARHF